jgi:ABC-type phosphate transport system ATPase subunit
VWRQALVIEADVVRLGSARYLVTRSKANRLREVVSAVDGASSIGIEQNPKTNSRWTAIARSGKRVMQFIRDGRYVAVVADGNLYRHDGGSEMYTVEIFGIVALAAL